MKAFFKNMKLKHKLMLPNGFYALVLGAVVFFAFNTHKVVDSAFEQQTEMAGLSDKFRNDQISADYK